MLLCILPLLATADEPSVADNIRAMDADHDGQVSVSEIREYLQKKYGADYEKDLLALMVRRANAKSCGSTLSNSFE